MKILVVGGGGREHALVWKISQSPMVERIFCAPGNAGIENLAECVPIAVKQLDELARFALDNKVDLTVVGPEDPLADGIVDMFRVRGLCAFGVSGRAAKLESSKAFSKEVMRRHGIPTGTFRTFNVAERAKAYIELAGAPIVVKADGLAKGKGVLVCSTVEEALAAVNAVMRDRIFGSAGDQVIVEQFLEGEEASVIAFTDGKTIAPMPSAQDHKPLLDGDKGPNTGGMGAYSPAPVVTDRMMSQIEREIVVQTVHAMNTENRPYEGILYTGLMLTNNGPKVLEFNCRFGDPETQPQLVRMKSDLVPVLTAIPDHKLEDCEFEWDNRASLCVVLAAPGYPDSPVKGGVIEGIEDAEALPDVFVFHSGTKRVNNKITVNGGRVLGVTALGDTIVDAQRKAYQAVERIHFDGMQFRTDIGQKAIDRLAGG